MISPPKPVASPCIKVCIVDGESGAWSALPEAEREAVMADLPGRRGRIDPAKLG